MKLKDLKIGTQLCIGMGAILVLVVLLGATAWFQVNNLWQETKGLHDHTLQVGIALDKLTIDIFSIHRDMDNLVLAENEVDRKSVIQIIDTYEDDAYKKFDLLYDRYLGPRSDIDIARNAFVQWKSIRDESVRLLRDGKTAEAANRNQSRGVEGIQVGKVWSHVQKIKGFAWNKGEQFYQDAQEEKDTLMRRLVMVFGAIFLLTLIVGYLLLKGIRKPLQELTRAVDQFGSDKLDARSRYASANEFGMLASSFNAMAETIQREIQSKESATRITDEAGEFAESVINTVREPLIALDQDLRVVKVSRSFYEFFKVEPEETVGQLIYDLGNKQWDIPRLRELLETILPQKATLDNYEVEHNFNSIGKRIMLLNARQIKRVLGKDRVLLLAIEDITERREIEDGREKSYEEMEAKVDQRTKDLQEINLTLREEILERERVGKELQRLLGELRQSEAALIEVEKVGALGTLTAGIAHELNNPLMGMLNFVQYCLKHTPEDKRIFPILEDIKRETERCVEIVKNLLTFSHQEKEGEEQCRKCYITLILERIFKLLAYRIEKENVLINQHVADGIPECWIKENNMQQVFLNIIGNALDAVREADRKEIRIEVTGDGESVRVTVSDTGCGIPLENKTRIFDPFFTTKPVGQGTGLGLSICQGIIKDQGGKISCESSPGAGARFEIVLPIDSRVKRDEG